MRIGTQIATVAIALMTGAGVAVAASADLTMQQKQTIRQAIPNGQSEAAPANFQANVGEKVPESVMLKPLPSSVTGEISSLKGDSYAKLDNGDILIVNKSDRKVAAIVKESSMGRSATSSEPANQPSMHENSSGSGNLSVPHNPK